MSKSDGPCGCDATPAADADVQNPSDTTGQWVSVYAVPKMDCPSEERMIRLALNGLDGVRKLTFDLSDRRLDVTACNRKQPCSQSAQFPAQINCD